MEREVGNRGSSGYFMEDVEEAHLVSQEPMKRCGSDTALSAATGGGCFDCNICLEFAVEPVVTLCGHLYCWPCIYRWLQQVVSESPQQCPVCKASVTLDSLVPLYGRGHAAQQSHLGLKDIPRRPSLRRDQAGSEPGSPGPDEEDDGDNGDLHPSPILRRRQQHYHQDRPYYGYSSYGDHVSPPQSPLRSPSGTRMIHSTAGEVLGGIAIAVLPWVFRNQEAGMGEYYSSPRGMAVGGGGRISPRLRQRELRVERSLHQIWVFLFCCALLCLFLF